MVIEVENLSYRYPGAKKWALKDISLKVEEGEFLCIVGRNESGKSTLGHALVGLIPHFFGGIMRGEVIVKGKNTKKTGIAEIAKDVGLIFQNPLHQLSGIALTVFEEVAFGLENFGFPREEMVERVNVALEQVGIENLKDRSPYELSGGEQQRVALACVLALRPSILVLDEPTSELDPRGSAELFQVVKKMNTQGMTIVMIEHKVERIAEYAHRVVVMSEGKIVMEGEPQKVFTHPLYPSYQLEPPIYTRLALQLKERGWWPTSLPITIDETEQVLKGILDGRNRSG